MLAITDHDTIAGVRAAQTAAEHWGITLVPGVEISAVSGQEEIHLLGYFVDVDNPELKAFVARAQEARQERAQQILARLAQWGVPIEWDRVVAKAGGNGSIGRAHIAATMVEQGYVRSWDEAFEQWIGPGRPAYVERYKLSPEEAIQLVRRSGGLPALAHPYIFTRNGECKAALDLARWLPRLRDAGLEGIEVYYPNYPHRLSRQLLTWAIRYGLFISGGSDFHGEGTGSELGGVAVPWAVWEGLERRHRCQVRRDLVESGHWLN
mgnify:CR=1 FL=1